MSPGLIDFVAFAVPVALSVGVYLLAARTGVDECDTQPPKVAGADQPEIASRSPAAATRAGGERDRGAAVADAGTLARGD